MVTPASEVKIEFTKQMRKATREIHDISDALVNAKLGIGIDSYLFQIPSSIINHLFGLQP